MLLFWGELAALGTAFCWTLASIVFTRAGRQIGAFNLNKLRIPIAALCLTGALALTATVSHIGRLQVSDSLWLAVSGVIGLVLGDSCYFRALVILGPRRATLLMSSAPVLAALLAWTYLNEGLGWVAWAGILTTLAGICWVTAERDSQNNEYPHGSRMLGVLLGLGGAAGQAIGLVIARRVMVASDVTPLAGTWVRMIAAAVTIWSYALLRGQARSTLLLLRQLSIARVVIAGAILGPFLGVWLSLIAVKYVEAGIAATIMATVPVLVLPLVVLIYREKVSPRAVLGALVAVGGVAMLFLR